MLDIDTITKANFSLTSISLGIAGIDPEASGLLLKMAEALAIVNLDESWKGNRKSLPIASTVVGQVGDFMTKSGALAYFGDTRIFAPTSDIKASVISYMPEGDRESIAFDWMDIGERLSEMAKKCITTASM